MESLRDQLSRLFPELAKKDKRDTKRTRFSTGNPGSYRVDGGVRTHAQGSNPPAQGQNASATGELKPSVSRSPSAEQRNSGDSSDQNMSSPKSGKILLGLPGKTDRSVLSGSNQRQVTAPSPHPEVSPSLQVANDKIQEPLRQPPLSRDSEFKYPEAWVASGSSLQPPGSEGGRVLPVCIGIDFGTAYTKVAIRVGSASAGAQVHFVPWMGVRNHPAVYYMPGEISLDGEGGVWFGRLPNFSAVMNNLKLPFIDRAIRTKEQFIAATTFLAWVMRYSRAWLYQVHRSVLRGRTLAWTVNLGCPTSSWSERDLHYAYETLGMFAWQMSQDAKGIRWDAGVEVAKSGRPELDAIGLDALHLMPEFVAQVVGYARSPQRNDGLHLLMDVGAGTVDLATFNVGPLYGADPDEGGPEDRYSIFADSVLPLGTHYLMANRIQSTSNSIAWDDFQRVPDADQFSTAINVEREAVALIDKRFTENVTREIFKLLRYTRERRYGRAPEWSNGLPAFLSGGGAGCKVYEDALYEAFARLRAPLKRTSFPLLEEAARLENVDTESFHRLSVAYGLTYDAETVGRIYPPSQIEDAPRITSEVAGNRERPDRDELYPK